jgi:nicotinate-nucleotide adenylyltransferase
MPSHTPPHKPAAERDPGPEHRLAMCRIAVDGIPNVGVSALEIERGGLSYTVDTLKTIHAGEGEARLTLLVGADVALSLPTWREPRSLLELADLAIAERDGVAREQVLRALAVLTPDQDRISFLRMPKIEASSSMVRAQLMLGEQPWSESVRRSLGELLTVAVAAYIERHGLYRGVKEEVSDGL